MVDLASPSPSILSTVYFILYTMYFILYTICYTIYYMLYTIYYTLFEEDGGGIPISFKRVHIAAPAPLGGRGAYSSSSSTMKCQVGSQSPARAYSEHKTIRACPYVRNGSSQLEHVTTSVNKSCTQLVHQRLDCQQQRNLY